MQKFKIDQDIRSMSDVRNAMAAYIKQIQDTRRPLIITQHGKGVAVLLAANEFEAMQEKIALLSDVQTALGQVAKGQGISHQQAKARLLERIDK